MHLSRTQIIVIIAIAAILVLTIANCSASAANSSRVEDAAADTQTGTANDPSAPANQQSEAATYPASTALDVPYISQYPNLPTGCEITAATMLVNYYGIDIENTELADYLDISNDFYYDENYGTIPEGNPISTSDILAESDGGSSGDDASGSGDTAAADDSASDDASTASPEGLPPDDENAWHGRVFHENPFEGMIGPDPDLYFIGSPYSDDGLFCNPQPVANAINSYAAEHGSTLRAKALIGYTTDQLYQLVSQGKPVVVWVTLYMGQYPNDLSWKTESGKIVRTTSIDHAMVLTGYDAEAGVIYVNDSMDSSSTEYSFEEFEAAYALRGNQALVIDTA